MRLKVQHNRSEIGPFSIPELQQATDSGRICMMDWCWNQDDYDGIMTVYQVLCEGRVGIADSTAVTTAHPSKPIPRPEASPSTTKTGEAASSAAHAALEDYKRRLDHDLLNARMKLAEDRRSFAKDLEEFYHERSQMEADLAHAREDIVRIRESIAEDRKRLTEHYRRHSRHVESFNEMRRKTLAEIAAERRRLSDELGRVAESESRLNRERESWEKARQAANAEAEEQRRNIVEEQRRLQEATRRLNSEKAGFEERWQGAYEKLEEERRRVTDESRQLLDLERRVRSEKEDFEKRQRRFTEELRKLDEGTRLLDEARRSLEEERRNLEAERRELDLERKVFERRQAGAARHERTRNSPAVQPPVRDEKYYGRILGLRGKVSFDSIKRAYRAAALRCHPDKVQDLHPEFGSLATDMIREVNEAFDFFKARYAKREE